MIECVDRRSRRIMKLITENPGIENSEIMKHLKVSADQVYRALRVVRAIPGFLFTQSYLRRDRHYTQSYANANNIEPVVAGPLWGHDYRPKKKRATEEKKAAPKVRKSLLWVPGRLALEMSE